MGGLARCVTWQKALGQVLRQHQRPVGMSFSRRREAARAEISCTGQRARSVRGPGAGATPMSAGLEALEHTALREMEGAVAVNNRRSSFFSRKWGGILADREGGRVRSLEAAF